MTRWLGSHCTVVESCGSTSDEIARLARVGAPHGSVVVASTQTAGRGRAGRTWHSPPGMGLYCSILLRLPLQPRDVPPLTLAVGIGACDAARAAGAPATLKWPNDLVVRSERGLLKLGGILTETSSAAGRIDSVIVGIGINLVLAPPGEPVTSIPADVADLATSIAACSGAAPDRDAFAARLLTELEPWIDRYVAGGVPAVAGAWQERAERVARVRASANGKAIEGKVDGLDPDGALRVIDDDGVRHRVLAGDVLEVRPITVGPR